MAGLYVHIPFCKSRCIYCGFYSTTRLAMCHRYIEALHGEMLIRRASQQQLQINTIYIGGGTPSVLSAQLLRKLFIYIYNVYELKNRVGSLEITVECNPDDITPQLVECLQHLHVNRVSMGVQTFDMQRLVLLKRRHNPKKVDEAVKQLRDAGIGNISIDLIYGFPQQTLSEWQSDVNQALKLNVEHISAYALSYEEDTPLYKMLKQGIVKEADDELQRSMYYYLKECLEHAGFEHYEISNFAKSGYRSRHNSSYWNHTPYIGLGAGAHSFNGNERTWNVSNLDQYISSIEEGILPSDGELLDSNTLYNEKVMTGLRTREGINLSSLSYNELNYCMLQAKPFINGGLLLKDNDKLVLSREGLFVSDMIISNLMIV